MRGPKRWVLNRSTPLPEKNNAIEVSQMRHHKRDDVRHAMGIGKGDEKLQNADLDDVLWIDATMFPVHAEARYLSWVSFWGKKRR
jgi:hypothetical protein